MGIVPSLTDGLPVAEISIGRSHVDLRSPGVSLHPSRVLTLWVSSHTATGLPDKEERESESRGGVFCVMLATVLVYGSQADPAMRTLCQQSRPCGCRNRSQLSFLSRGDMASILQSSRLPSDQAGKAGHQNIVPSYRCHVTMHIFSAKPRISPCLLVLRVYRSCRGCPFLGYSTEKL
jgi:hypothetical protein